MRSVSKTMLAVVAAGAMAGASPAAAGHGDGYAERGLGPVLWQVDLSPYDRLGTRIHRTAVEDGFFGHGRSDGRGGYDYDRGYPYDHYEDRSARTELPIEEAAPREVRCDTEWTRDDASGDKVPVTICRG